MATSPRGAPSALASLLVLVLAPGCHLARWGRGEADERYSPAREAWEVPLGWALTPLAVALDATVSLGLTLLIGAGNPINWLAVALDEEPFFVLVIFLPLTSSALTLANPHCNLDWTRAAPEGVSGIGWDDDEADLDPEAQRQEWRSDQEQREHQRVEERLR